MIFCLYNIKPTALVAALQVRTKGRFRKLLSTEGGRLKRVQPEQLSSLAGDLSNLKQVALQLGYPAELLDKAAAAKGKGILGTPSTKGGKGDDLEDDDEEGGRRRQRLGEARLFRTTAI